MQLSREIDNEIDRSLELVWDMAEAGRYQELDDLLIQVSIEHANFIVLVTLLTGTAICREHLKNRSKFYEGVLSRATAERGPEMAVRILEGLE